jgi:hypothetical protein
MDNKEIEARIKELESQVITLKDIEALKRLQRSYGYYLEHWMYEEIIDCFSDSPDTVLSIIVGVFLGKEGVRRYFTGEKARSVDPELLHQVMQLSGVVDIDPDGKTARGRWYGFGTMAVPAEKGVLQMLSSGIYTVEYIKENGKWKILKLIWNPAVNSSPLEGWVKPERLAKITPDQLPQPPRPDKARDFESRYPSGYIPPFHYRHPVTGKETSVKEHNDSVKKMRKSK